MRPEHEAERALARMTAAAWNEAETQSALIETARAPVAHYTDSELREHWVTIANEREETLNVLCSILRCHPSYLGE